MFALLCVLQCSATDLEMDDLDECDQVTQVIGYHPHYRDHFLRTQNFIMKGDGPLPYAYRYYLAIIVSTLYTYISSIYSSLMMVWKFSLSYACNWNSSGECFKYFAENTRRLYAYVCKCYYPLSGSCWDKYKLFPWGLPHLFFPAFPLSRPVSFLCKDAGWIYSFHSQFSAFSLSVCMGMHCWQCIVASGKF